MLCVELGELIHDDRLLGARLRVVEADEQVAGRDLVAVLDQDLPHDAAVAVLNLLHRAFDDDASARDHRAGNLGEHGPAADPAHAQHDDGGSDEHVRADAVRKHRTAAWRMSRKGGHV